MLLLRLLSNSWEPRFFYSDVIGEKGQRREDFSMSDLLSASEREAVLRRALIRVKPEYFSWPGEAQERYRLNMPEADVFRLRQTLMKSLFQIQVDTSEQLDEAFDTFSNAQYLQFNSTLLPLQGIGEDCFFLNEYLGDDSLLDFPTLYDYDYADHCFQEQARQEEDPSCSIRPYRGNLFHCWARLFVDGNFFYASLSSVASYLYSEIEESGFDAIQELIPHTYVDGKDHSKREGEGIRYDKRVDANGMEAQLDELQHQYWQWLSERHRQLSEEFDMSALKRVYVRDCSQVDDPQLHFVFTDKTALQAVRLKSFVRDCRSIAGDQQELEAWIKRERQAAQRYVEQTYQDILDHFDPKVVKLRRKRKIILSDRAAKDLL